MFTVAHHVDCFPGKTLRFLRKESLIEVSGAVAPEMLAAIRNGASGAKARRLLKPLIDAGLVIELPAPPPRSSVQFPAQLRLEFTKNGYPSGAWAMRVFRQVYLLNWSAEFWADAGARFLQCLLGSQHTRMQFLAARLLWRGPKTVATHFFTVREERWFIAQTERWRATHQGPSVALLDPIAKKVIASYRLTEPWDAPALFRPGGPCLSVERRKFSRCGRPFHVAFVHSGVTTAQEITEWPVSGSNGRADDAKTAELKGSVEAFERWVNGFVVPARLVKASRAEIGSTAVDPRRVTAYADWQYRRRKFPFHRFDPRRSVYWVKGRTMTDGSERYLLAETIFYPFPYASRRYTFASSSGSAAHLTKRKAEELALAELVERDAFMAHWLLRKPPRQIESASLPAELQSVIRECKGWKVTLLDLTLDAGVVILALGAHRNRSQGWILGAACSWRNPLVAARHALDEMKLQALCHQPHTTDKACAPHQVRSVSDHGRLYRNPRHQTKAAFLFQGASIRFADVTPQADAAAVRRGDVASTDPAISVDLTDSLPFKPPYAAVKVTVPGLIPIAFGYGLEPFGMPRLQALARLFGMRQQTPHATPHPFT